MNGGIMRRTILLIAISVPLSSCGGKPDFDVVLRNGLVCDGTGSPCTPGGVAISGDKIAKTGDVSADRGRIDIDVHGQVIAPGFINLMSSHEGLFADGRGLSDLLQGVTLEIFGEGARSPRTCAPKW
jgi:N-acyl-D-amino-acid deacylase